MKEDGPFHCVSCREKRAGRFCNAFAQSSGWSQGHTHVSWYCWTCQPYGTAVRPSEVDPTQEPPSSRAARGVAA